MPNLSGRADLSRVAKRNPSVNPESPFVLSYHAFINLLGVSVLVFLLSLVGLIVATMGRNETGQILSVLGLALFPSLIMFGNKIHRPRPQAALTACKSNLKNVATALEMYATDNGRKLPERLSQLMTGNYLKTIPTCPVSRSDTYSGSYEHAPPTSFTLFCQGHHHREASRGLNQPLYTSIKGIQ